MTTAAKCLVFFMKNDQLTAEQEAIETINVKSSTLGAVFKKNIIKTTRVDAEVR